MRNTQAFKNKKVLVVGLARSGLACANLLYDLGSKVSITDNNDNQVTKRFLKELKSEKIRVELGGHSPDFIEGSDLIIISPGVSEEADCLFYAKKLNIPIISEIEFAWRLCPAKVIAVTGSNGKTTVTTLIGRMLQEAGFKAFACGNIGVPFSSEVEKMRADDFVVLEVSSFQLEKIKEFKPSIAVILNLSANHLDRYRSMQEYLEAKLKIFVNQDESDYLVLNGADPVLKQACGNAASRKVFFHAKENLNPNAACLMSVGEILGIEKKVVLDLLKDFKGIEHRLELVAEINKIKFVNDSKSTTVNSTLWALRNIDSPVILIAGGRHKGVDYGSLLAPESARIKKVILIGEAKELIKKSLSGHFVLEEAVSLEEAVDKACRSAEKGDCVLLSPMCSSFDMFSDYEERGRRFKTAVKAIYQKCLET